MSSSEPATMTLAADDAVELGQMLEFLHDWIEDAPDPIGQWLARFTGGGYELAELRTDLARFAFLLGGDGDRFVFGAQR